ncbi:MAG TPA: hypothetical protein DF613_04265 [Lachnospiraceae bacterium]|nr:hypothetical protein [Lachnospiraceae bacterium]
MPFSGVQFIIGGFAGITDEVLIFSKKVSADSAAGISAGIGSVETFSILFMSRQRKYVTINLPDKQSNKGR